MKIGRKKKSQLCDLDSCFLMVFIKKNKTTTTTKGKTSWNLKSPILHRRSLTASTFLVKVRKPKKSSAESVFFYKVWCFYILFFHLDTRSQKAMCPLIILLNNPSLY